MESLGHYLLRERIVLPGGGPVEVYEGQDARTGLDVLVFRPLLEQPPKLSIPHALSWIDRAEDAWIAEIPVGAVRATWLAGRLDVARLTRWCRQLLALLHQAQEGNVPVGWIVPELVWARGSQVWLGGVGVSNPAHRWDFWGLLNTLKVLAGEVYPALPWRAALEEYVEGRLGYADLVPQLEPLALREPQDPSSPASEPQPNQRERWVQAEGEVRGDFSEQEGVSSSLEDSLMLRGEAKQMPEKPSLSKSLSIQVNEPSPAATSFTPPRRIRIEERLEPPFEVIEPPPQNQRALLWLWLIPLFLLLAGVGLWIRSRGTLVEQPTVYPVEFRLQPPGPSASLVILEIPEGSKMPLNTEVAQLPGRVDFDKPGVYRIRVRVQGRVPVESLIEVPNPGGVTISLR